MSKPGDLLFYRSHGGLFDDAIVLATGAPYTHVEVQVSATESIGALSEGVVRHAIPAGADVAAMSARIEPERLTDGLFWLTRQVGKPYGWADIGDDAEQLVSHDAPVVIRPGEMCCSDLATRFLLHCGYRGLPDALFDQPELVSPNTLARAVGIMPSAQITAARYPDMSERARDFARRMATNPHVQAVMRRLANK